MKKLLLLLLLAAFGVFVYFISFKGMIIYPLIPAVLLLLGLYYAVAVAVTEKMVKKALPYDFFFLKCSKISDDEMTIASGALAIGNGEAIFYTKKDASSLKVSWSCAIAEIESYTFCKVDDRHKGMEFKLTGREQPVKFASSSADKNEEGIRKALGWN